MGGTTFQFQFSQYQQCSTQLFVLFVITLESSDIGKRPSAWLCLPSASFAECTADRRLMQRPDKMAHGGRIFTLLNAKQIDTGRSGVVRRPTRSSMEVP